MTPPLPSASSAGLPAGGWGPGVQAALERLIADAPPGSSAVFDFDDTLIAGDCQDTLFAWALERLDLRLSPARLADALWLPHRLAGMREAVDDALEAAEALCVAGWRPETGEGVEPLVGSPDHVRLARGLWAVFHGMVEDPRLPTLEAFLLQARLLAGRTASEVSAAARASIAPAAPVLELSPRPPGVRPLPEAQALVRALAAAGVAVWVVSASMRPIVVGLATDPALGFCLPAERVIAVDLATGADGRLSPGLRPDAPVTWGAGKMEALSATLDRPPVLIAGDSRGDLEMLEAWPGQGARLLVPRDPAGALGHLCARARGGEAGWLHQPRDRVTGAWIPAGAP